MHKPSVLLSIKPKYCELIANGKKTIEVRKTKPKLEPPFKCYIYCTKPSKKYQTVSGCMVLNDDELFRLPNDKIKYGNSIEMIAYDNYTADNFLNGKVIGEFVCDEIDKYSAEFVESPKDTYEEIRQIWLDNEGDECDAIIATNERDDSNSCEICRKSCLSFDELREYIGVNFHDYPFYGWHISDLKIYDEPKELKEFTAFCDESENRCKNCEHWHFDNDKLNGYRRWCSVYHRKPLSRPPQSWCYVEEV